MVIVAASATGTVALLADGLEAGDRRQAGGESSVHARAGRIGAGRTVTATGTVEPARAHRLLAGDPYLGVSCAMPNSIACDRVGLAVWLKRPASRVTAEIDGRRFALDDPEASARPEMFAGYLQPAGLRDGDLRVPARAGDRWFGAGDVSARVRLWVAAGGRTRTVRVEVPLRAGWG